MSSIVAYQIDGSIKGLANLAIPLAKPSYKPGTKGLEGSITLCSSTAANAAVIGLVKVS